MKRVRIEFTFLALLFISFNALSQTRIVHSLNRSTKTISIQQNSSQLSSLRILALMVDFQTDTDSRTAGKGSFLKRGESWGYLDPAPHDSAYFANKILFVSNYFRKVSNGKLTISGDVWGKVITLSKPMSAYAPPTIGDDFSKLVECIAESWRTADSLFSEIDFSQYNTFVIFHAGSGRDIDIVNLLGYNPTPYDLPSLFIDSATISRSSSEISVDNGQMKITHTLFLPETESRILDIIPADTLQLSINGLFAALIGNRLGLPDLYDTKTGRSGIGQFGVMDGAGIFAYNGIFPPEPSAWEKMTLGWLEPIQVRNSSTLTLPAVGLSTTGMDTVYKIDISPSEYYLVENRNRDPLNNGQTLTVVDSSNQIKTLTFLADTSGFNLYSIISISGSVIDVEDFDWALPGYIDSTHRYDGGGILIWHIDDNVIEANHITNTINAGTIHGIDLEEADGSQDIGQSYGEYSAGSGTEYGSPLDCWFEENNAFIYKNRFDESTFPNTHSNTGARSLISIRDFSKRLPIMTFSVDIGSIGINRIESLQRTLQPHEAGTVASLDSILILTSGSSIYVLSSNGKSLLSNSDGELSSSGGSSEVACKRLSNSELLIASVHGKTVYSWILTDGNNDGIYENIQNYSKNLSASISTSPALVHLNGNTAIAFGNENGMLWFIDSSCVVLDSIQCASTTISAIAFLSDVNARDSFFVAAGNKIYSRTSSAELNFSPSTAVIGTTKDNTGEWIAVGEKFGKRFAVYSASLQEQYWSASLPVDSICSIAIGDINGDGWNEVLINGGSALVAYNKYGAMVENFPIHLLTNELFVGTPLIADINDDGVAEVLTISSQGILRIYKKDGTMLSGTPLQLSTAGTNNLALMNVGGSPGICILHAQGIVSGIKFSSPFSSSENYWTQEQGSSQRFGFAYASTHSIQSVKELLPANRAYNWPNPVRGNSTFIRFYVSDQSDVTILIFDLSGNSITSLKTIGKPNVDNEIEWNVTNIQSGIYFAHLEAKSATRSSSTIIKIAVVK